MKLRFGILASLLALALTFGIACNHGYPTNAVIPPTQVIWKNGVAGSWLGNYIWSFSEQCVISIIANPTFFIPCIASTPINTQDNINGDTTCMTYYHPPTGSCTSGTMLEGGFNSWGTPQHGLYYYPVTLSGPMQQITLAWSPGPVTLIYPVTVTAPPNTLDASAYYPNGHIQFDIRLETPASTFSSMVLDYGSSAGIGAAYNINFSALSTSHFTHLSIPLSAFSSNQTAAVDEPFDLTIVVPGSLPATFVTVNDVEWTGN